jgi:hypothetical protein
MDVASNSLTERRIRVRQLGLGRKEHPRRLRPGSDEPKVANLSFSCGLSGLDS